MHLAEEKMKMKRSILWMASSGIVALLSFAGLLAMERVADEPGDPNFFFTLLSCTVFLLSYATFLISFLCRIAGLLFPRKNGN
jgi:hypothetical protein